MIEDLVWEIKGKDLRHLDKLRIGLNTETDLLVLQEGRGLPNIYTVKNIRKRLREMQGIAKKAKPESNFEDIVLDDIISTMEAIDTYTAFYYLPSGLTTEKEKIKVGRLLEKLYDGKTFNYLMDLGREYSYQNQHQLYRLQQWADRHSYPPEEEKIQSLINKYESKVKKTLQYFGEETGFSEPGLDFKLVLCDRNEWPLSIKRMRLNKERLIFYKSGSRIKILRGLLLIDAIHEYSHAAHETRSQKMMPAGLKLDPMTNNGINCEAMLEGIARHMEKFALGWMYQRQKKLDLTQSDLKQARLAHEAEIYSFLPDVIYSLLKLRKNRGEDIDMDKAIKKLFKTNYYSLSNCLTEKAPNELIENMNIIAGYSLVEGVIDALKEEKGEGWVRKNQVPILKGLMTGAFRPRAAQRFLTEIYLPEMGKRGYLKD